MVLWLYLVCFANIKLGVVVVDSAKGRLGSSSFLVFMLHFYCWVTRDSPREWQELANSSSAAAFIRLLLYIPFFLGGFTFFFFYSFSVIAWNCSYFLLLLARLSYFDTSYRRFISVSTRLIGLGTLWICECIFNEANSVLSPQRAMESIGIRLTDWNVYDQHQGQMMAECGSPNANRQVNFLFKKKGAKLKRKG